MKKRTILWFLAIVAAAVVVELVTTAPRSYPLPTTFEVHVNDTNGRAIPAATVRFHQSRAPDARAVVLVPLADAVADDQGVARAEIDLVGRVSRGWVSSVLSRLGEDSVRRRAAVAETLSGVIVSAGKPGWPTKSVVMTLDEVRNRVELVGDTWRDRRRLELEVELTLAPDGSGSENR
ncbi:MAG: hypothetical protein IPM29_15165 [Planctomycetes bacterium]|nr:hypothetical protein [Planctomycetota bacterium]